MDEPERQRIVTILAGQIDTAPSDRSVFLCYLHPFRGEWAIPTAAFSVTARNFLFAEAIWDDAQGDDVNERWLRRAMATVERHAVGHYIAGADRHADPGRSRRSFTPSAWQRLSRMRERHDPDNLFHAYLGLEAGGSDRARALARQDGERWPGSP